jgi:hypothetical protein
LTFNTYFKSFAFITQLAGGYREVAIPRSIPNLEVKHFIADNTAGSPCRKRKSLPALSFFYKPLLNLSLIALVEAFLLGFLVNGEWEHLGCFSSLLTSHYSLFTTHNLLLSTYFQRSYVIILKGMTNDTITFYYYFCFLS